MKEKELLPQKKRHDNKKIHFTMEMARRICRSVATCGNSLEKICNDNPEFPKPTMIYEWRLDYPEFAEMYVTAKRIQTDILFEELIKIADNTSNDTIIKIDKLGQEYAVCNSEWIMRSRVRIDTRKWALAKLVPRIYGDRIISEATVTVKHEDALKELE